MPTTPPPPSDCCGPTWRKWFCHRVGYDTCFTFHRPPHLQHQRVDWCGFWSVFSAKFLLEVVGAAGAVWGFSEVIGWRIPIDTPIGPPPLIGPLMGPPPPPPFEDGPPPPPKEVLEEEFFQMLCAWTFCLFLIRFYWHAKHWLEHEHDFPIVKIHHRRQHVIHFVQVFGAKLLLQVCGAGGAIWGASEVVCLRNDDNKEAWRLAALSVADFFFLRWVLEIMSYCLLCGRCTRLQEEEEDDDVMDIGNHHEPISSSSCLPSTLVSDNVLRLLLKVVKWNEVTAVKFVLEVCGAMGAVWGFSEIMDWRHDGLSEWHWHKVALTVGFIFTFRWLYQTCKFVSNQREHHHLVTEPLSVQKRTSVVLAHDDLHVRHSMKRLSQSMHGRPSVRALLTALQDLDLEEDSDTDDDPEVPFNDSEEPSDGNNQNTAKEEEAPFLDTNSTQESYSSCD